MFEALSAQFSDSEIIPASEWKSFRNSGGFDRYNSKALCFRVVGGKTVQTHHDPFQPFCNLPSDVCVVFTQN